MNLYEKPDYYCDECGAGPLGLAGLGPVYGYRKFPFSRCQKCRDAHERQLRKEMSPPQQRRTSYKFTKLV